MQDRGLVLMEEGDRSDAVACLHAHTHTYTHVQDKELVLMEESDRPDTVTRL